MCKEMNFMFTSGNWIPFSQETFRAKSAVLNRHVDILREGCNNSATTLPVRQSFFFHLMSGISTPILKLFGRFVEPVINICPSCPRSAVASSDASEGNTYSLVLTGDRTVSRSLLHAINKNVKTIRTLTLVNLKSLVGWSSSYCVLRFTPSINELSINLD